MLFLQLRRSLKPSGLLKIVLQRISIRRGHMIADKGELDETIVDQMDLDDEEYITFVEGRDGRLFKNDDTILEDWGNFAMDELTVNDGHDSNWVYNQMEITSGQLFHDKKHL